MTSIKQQVRTVLNKDGVDHINVFSYGETDIGRITSPDWRRNFYIPHVGDFVSARAFANWIISGGNEELRHSTAFYKTAVPTKDFRLLTTFAKYYQLCTMRSNLVTQQDMLKLPWVMYRKHFSGIREYDRWESYPQTAKSLAQFILDKGSKQHYHWDTVNPEVMECLNFYLQKITGEDFIPFEDLNRLAKERSMQRSKEDKTPDTESSGFNGSEEVESAEMQIILEEPQSVVQQVSV